MNLLRWQKWCQQMLFLLLLISVTIPLVAQEENTETPEPFTRADNECYEGGTMEGRCNSDIDGDGVISQSEVDWAWTCGWYIARFNDSTFNRGNVPFSCNSLMPPVVAGENTDGPNTECIIYELGGPTKFCLTGNFLNQTLYPPVELDPGAPSYIISDDAPGENGNCPAGTDYLTDVGNFDAMIADWLMRKGFQATDNVCLLLSYP